jgi:hypothetical protein
MTRQQLAERVAARLVEREHLLELMVEPPGGENHGCRTDGGGGSLNRHDWITEDFLAVPGWCTERPRSDRTPGRPKTIEPEWLTPKAIAAVERRLDFCVTDFQRVTEKGRLCEEDRPLREEIAQRLAAVVQKGAVVSGLAEVLGRNERTIWRLAASGQEE